MTSSRTCHRSSIATVRALAIAAVVAALAAGCAPGSKLPQISEEAAKREREIQQELAFEQFYDNNRRVHVITYPLLKASAALCGDDTARGMGLFITNKHGFKKDYWAAAARVAGLGDQLMIAAVAPESAGERAGVREGDLLETVNGWQAPKGKGAHDKLGEKLNEIAKAKADPVLTIRRGSDTLTMTLNTDVVCNYTYTATEKSVVNASADGKNLRVEAGMLRFLPNDDDLAIIVGHEIAHNVMGHRSKKTANYALGSVVDILFAGFGINTQGAFGNIGARAFSQEFEAEADYVGLYIIGRAGRRIDNAPQIWRRMALDDPSSIEESLLGTHPSNPERFLALEKTIAEIKAKQAAGKPLLPEKEEPTAAPVPTPPTQ